MAVHRELRRVVRAGHRVVHVRAAEQLALLVINDVFQQGLANALRNAAMELTVHQHRIDDGAEIVDCRVLHHLRVARDGVDLHLADVAAVGVGGGRSLADMVDVERRVPRLREGPASETLRRSGH